MSRINRLNSFVHLCSNHQSCNDRPNFSSETIQGPWFQCLLHEVPRLCRLLPEPLFCDSFHLQARYRGTAKVEPFSYHFQEFHCEHLQPKGRAKPSCGNCWTCPNLAVEMHWHVNVVFTTCLQIGVSFTTCSHRCLLLLVFDPGPVSWRQLWPCQKLDAF